MNYHYYQQKGGEETWKPIAASKLSEVADAMFVTILSVSTPITEDYTKEQYADVKYKGPMYFDLDDAESPAGTAINAVELIENLQNEFGLNPECLEIFASGSKGFHILVPEAVFLEKPPAQGFQYLPAVYKEMAFKLAVDSLDMRVYTARKGRMLRQRNVQRENGRYKVCMSFAELKEIADQALVDMEGATQRVVELTSKPRSSLDVFVAEPELNSGLMALFDASRAKVMNAAKKAKKAKKVTLPSELPSFDAMLRGEGLKPDIGFHQIALQVGITAHAKGMDCATLIAAAEGLIQSHQSDGNRYDTPSKRRAELERMWSYTEDNPCYEYGAGAMVALLNHAAPDLRGVAATAEEVQQGIEEGNLGTADGEDDEYTHAGVTLMGSGAYVSTDSGMKRILAMDFKDVTEMVSIDTNGVTVMEANVSVGGRSMGRQTMEVESFNSTSSLNKMTMRHGQAFMGTDPQARGLYMRLVERARRAGNRMYATSREGLDLIHLTFHEDEAMRQPFLVWSDVEKVTTAPHIGDSVKLRFVGFPSPMGHFQTDISKAPNLASWIKDDDNRELLRKVVHSMLNCQRPAYLGKLLGWMVACHWRMLFHRDYSKFPLLHINGSAGAGKTETTKLMSNLHYYMQEPKMLTPTSTIFAVQNAASGSASIPLILDEFKPAEMKADTYDRFKLMLRDAYNCRSVERGGGNRDNSDYRAVHHTQLSAPMCFIAEAAENESALMERVVMLTMVKPPVVDGQAYYANYRFVQANREVLGIIGHYIAASIVRNYNADTLRNEFDQIYEAARTELMLQPGEEDTLTPDQVRKKAGAKDRVVYNYSVAKFGLGKLRSLVKSALKTDEFEAIFQEMDDNMFDSVADLQDQVIPEWLKVLNAFAPMAELEGMMPYRLQETIDYAYLQHAGKNCIEINVSQCYMKYRMYYQATGLKPLFPSPAAFGHALSNVPSLVEKGTNHKLKVQGGTYTLDLDELRDAGFIEPKAKM